MKEKGLTFDEARLELVMEQIRLAGLEAEAGNADKNTPACAFTMMIWMQTYIGQSRREWQQEHEEHEHEDEESGCAPS